MGISLLRRRLARASKMARERRQAMADEETREKLATFVEGLRRAGKPPAEIDRLSKLYVERLVKLNEERR